MRPTWTEAWKQVIGEALEALRERDQGLHDSGDSERQQEAVRSMLEFAEKDRVRLENITVKELIREGRWV